MASRYRIQPLAVAETTLRVRDGQSFPHSFAGKLHFSALHPGRGAGFSLLPQMLWQQKKDIKCFSMTYRHSSDNHETSVFSPSPSAQGCSRNFPFEAGDHQCRAVLPWQTLHRGS